MPLTSKEFKDLNHILENMESYTSSGWDLIARQTVIAILKAYREDTEDETSSD